VAVTARDFARVSKRFAHVWEGVTWHSLAVNVGLRLLILAFTIDALINAGDERFAGKALGSRNVGILLGLSMLFPLLQAVRGQWKRYPMWYDNLYLSIFALLGVLVYVIVFLRSRYLTNRRAPRRQARA
jgi:hypothetical protein